MGHMFDLDAGVLQLPSIVCSAVLFGNARKWNQPDVHACGGKYLR